jgi:hypothetical protein
MAEPEAEVEVNGAKPYVLRFAFPGKQPGEIVWRKNPYGDFATAEAARQYAERKLQKQHWLVDYKIIGPDGEVPWRPAKENE